MKPLNKIQKELHDNKIFLNDGKVYRLIKKNRNTIYPKDFEYLNYINEITITYDDKIPKAKNFYFCHVNHKFIKPQKIDFNNI